MPAAKVGDIVIGSARAGHARDTTSKEHARLIAAELHRLGLIPDPKEVTGYRVEIMEKSIVVRATTYVNVRDENDQAAIFRVLAEVERLERKTA